jgi:hypothetical protein
MYVIVLWRSSSSIVMVLHTKKMAALPIANNGTSSYVWAPPCLVIVVVVDDKNMTVCGD